MRAGHRTTTPGRKDRTTKDIRVSRTVQDSHNQPEKQGQNSGGQSSNRDAAVNLMRIAAGPAHWKGHGDRRSG